MLLYETFLAQHTLWAFLPDADVRMMSAPGMRTLASFRCQLATFSPCFRFSSAAAHAHSPLEHSGPARGHNRPHQGESPKKEEKRKKEEEEKGEGNGVHSLLDSITSSDGKYCDSNTLDSAFSGKIRAAWSINCDTVIL